METPGRILIVKPDTVDLLNMTELLQREGYLCTLVQDKVEIVEAIDANAYDLVIIEIQISADKGQELIQAIHRSAPGMPVIICTVHPATQSATVSIQLPESAYQITHVQPRVLLPFVKTSIANYKASKQKEALLERTIAYAWAIEETIQVLEATRSSFKSKQLAALRRQLEQILKAGQNEIRPY